MFQYCGKCTQCTCTFAQTDEDTMFFVYFDYIFRHLLEMDLSLSREKLTEIADKISTHAHGCVSLAMRLFLIEDVIDSLKVS